MSKINKKKGALITLAWPQTLIPQENKWYDKLMQAIGILKDGYYKAGHSALVLIDYSTGIAHYFDFGRYHAPYQHGRVRDSWSDPDLVISTRAIINGAGGILNLEDILLELSKNRASHGDGRLEASVEENIDFNQSYSFTKNMQAKGAIKYGPLEINGINCSRFVAATGKASNINFLSQLALHFPYTISVSPMLNVRVIGNTGFKYSVENNVFISKASIFTNLKMLVLGKEMTILKPQYS
ncbi:MAG: hypothetical protein JKY48_09150 [Flavobacteriales bacterium]|nr:hypothetical protein [Flavobacteriales bacterium]